MFGSAISIAALAALAALAAVGSVPAAVAPETRPSVLIVTVDTLRPDRMSGYGYSRPTSPNVDRLMSRGARFAEARTVEPLTNPSLVTMLTSAYPHEHGATRNGLRQRPRLPSLPKVLAEQGYGTAAFVGNWTLRDKLSGMAEHFQLYEEVFSRRRWLFRREATAEDLTEQAVDWLRAHVRESPRRPFLLWVHYVEPHAPYRFWTELAPNLGIAVTGNARPEDRYDTEIAFVDRSVGDLLRAVEGLVPSDRLVVVFAGDHGESLGEHGEWGHGRSLYETGLRIPLGIVWPGHVPAGVVPGPASILDVAPTLLGLLRETKPRSFRGYDWSRVFHGAEPPRDRTLYFQTHKGAVLSRHESERARIAGLLEVGVLRGSLKEVFRPEGGRTHVFDLASDPAERTELSGRAAWPSEPLHDWTVDVYAGLRSSDELPVETLDPESAARLRSLGYAD